MNQNTRAEEQVGNLGRILEDSLNEIYIFESSSLRFLCANRGARENLGYTIEELCKLTPVDIKPAHTQKSFNATIMPLRTGEQTKLVFETLHRRKDGSCYEVEVHLQMGDYQEQSVFVAIILDITERNEAEAEKRRWLERSQKELNAVVQLSKERSIPDGDLDRFLENATRLVADTLEIPQVSVWLSKNQGSKFCCHVLYERNEGKHFKEPYLESEDHPNHFKELAKGSPINAHDVFSEVHTMDFAKGFLIPLGIKSLRDAPIRIGGELDGVLCVENQGLEREWTADQIAFASQVADQISLSLANRQLQQDEKSLRAKQGAINATVNGIIITDPCLPENPIIYVNPASERITGYSSEEVLDHNCCFLQRGDRDQDGLQELRTALKEEAEAKVVLSNYRKDGTPFWNELTVSPVRNSEGKVVNFVGIQRDITKTREAEAARKDLEREIVRIADEERRRIALDLHDGLGSHLGGLALICKEHARLLSMEGSPASDKANEISELIIEAVTQSREIAHGFYPIKEADTGLMDALQQLAIRTSRAEVRCFFDCVFPVLLHDSAIANHLYRIAQEAVSNALKHAGADEIIIDLSAVEKKVYLRITDNGCGVGAKESTGSDGIGLRTMAYRASLIDGELDLHNRTDIRGREIVCSCPLPEKEEENTRGQLTPGELPSDRREHSSQGWV